MARNSKDQSQAAHVRYLQQKQLEALRFALFAKAAESMGNRLETLRSQEQTESTAQAIDAIRSEWIVEE